jgi:serine phosphatase RsbU (regulator of sigma subunit)
MAFNSFSEMRKTIVLLILLFMALLFPRPVRGDRQITRHLLKEKPQGYELTDFWDWKYRAGDNKDWADPRYDDRSWQTFHFSTGIKTIMESRWQGSGWFRCRFRIGEKLRGKTAALYLLHLGTSDVYLNGELIQGVSEEAGGKIREWSVFTFDNHVDQVIAVRYVNPSAAHQRNMGFDTGFRLWLGTMDNTLSNAVNSKLFFLKYKISLTLTPLILAFLHLLLFLFYPRLRENLFYSICLIGFAAYFYAIMSRFSVPDAGEIIFFFRVSAFLNTFTTSFLLLAIYSIVYPEMPRRYRYFIYFAIGIGVWGVIKPVGLINYGVFLFSFIVIFECLRAFISNRPREKDGLWIILIGIFTLAVLSVYQVFDVIVPMIVQQITEPSRQYFRVYTYGGAVFIVCMTIYLSYHFAGINKTLEAQLAQVRELSEKNLLHERRARRQEMERRLLEADNARKTRELEEARKLQLSMLPEKIPHPPGLEIAVFMETAAEVGGDYYDFLEGKDQSLTAVIGDATGHGMKAGTMVTAIKSLFGTYTQSTNIPEFFSRCTKIIKGMNLGNLYMAMMMVKIQKAKIILSTAGMPPALIFREKSQTVEEILIKGPPLGGFTDFAYKQAETTIEKGDILLLLSDGFPERFNREDEMFGMDRVKKSFKEAAKESPADIISALNEAGEAWSGGRPRDDDTTFVVIKRNPDVINRVPT